MRWSYAVPVLSSLAGAALATWAYLGPATGVSGTAGALLALLGAVATTMGGMILMLGRPRLWLLALAALAAILTALAGWFLMQWALAIVMAVAFAGLLVAPVLLRRRASA